jgi:hypothetical protein
MVQERFAWSSKQKFEQQGAKRNSRVQLSLDFTRIFSAPGQENLQNESWFYASFLKVSILRENSSVPSIT